MKIGSASVDFKLQVTTTENLKAINPSQDKTDANIKLEKSQGIAECKTCSERKYLDDSNDPTVSFQTPTHVSPNLAGGAVLAHEQEHVAHEQAKASKEGRRVVSQSISLQSAVCPECGKTYVAGGNTRTVTKSESDNSIEKKFIDKFFGKKVDIKI